MTMRKQNPLDKSKLSLRDGYQPMIQTSRIPNYKPPGELLLLEDTEFDMGQITEAAAKFNVTTLKIGGNEND